jgi:hypothetical protein
MSYILDALKKAERDRLREDPKELDDFASSNWDPYQQSSKSDWPKAWVLMVCLVAMVIAVVLYSGLLTRPQTPAQQPILEANQSAPITRVIETPAPVSAPAAMPEPDVLPLPELQISGHMYMAEGSASNRLFANGGSFRQGDKLDKHWTLVAVGIEGIEISAGQRREFLPYR